MKEESRDFREELATAKAFFGGDERPAIVWVSCFPWIYVLLRFLVVVVSEVASFLEIQVDEFPV